MTPFQPGDRVWVQTFDTLDETGGRLPVRIRTVRVTVRGTIADYQEDDPYTIRVVHDDLPDMDITHDLEDVTPMGVLDRLAEAQAAPPAEPARPRGRRSK